MDGTRTLKGANLGGWDVHTHIVPPAIVTAAEEGRFGMKATQTTLHIYSHGVQLNPLAKVAALVDRVQSDGLDCAIVSVPPPLFRPDLSPADRASYAQLVNDGLLAAFPSMCAIASAFRLSARGRAGACGEDRGRSRRAVDRCRGRHRARSVVLRFGPLRRTLADAQRRGIAAFHSSLSLPEIKCGRTGDAILLGAAWQ